MKKLHKRLKHHIVAHKGNRFRPTIFSKESVAAIALTLLLIEGAYLVQTKIVMQSAGFTAAVLPTALTSLLNADRSAHALATLQEDPILSRAAQAKADDMAQRGYFAHVSPDGATFRQHLDDVGYSYSYAGENLAVDFEESVDVERAWMNSPTHRANLLKAEYTHVGFGVARGVYQGKEVTFVAQFFAAKRAGAAPRPTAADVPVTEIATISAEEDVRVLGTAATEASPTRAGASVAVMATSPSQPLWYMLMAFTALVATLLSLTVVAHIRNKYLYLEIVAGGLLILAIGLAMMRFNGGEGAEIPAEGETVSSLRQAS